MSTKKQSDTIKIQENTRGTRPYTETTREMQLVNKGNFTGKDGKLFLVRCLHCGEPPRGTENYAMAVASGQCAFCGWHE